MYYIVTRDPFYNYDVEQVWGVPDLGEAIIYAKDIHDGDPTLHVTVCKDHAGLEVIAVHHEVITAPPTDPKVSRSYPSNWSDEEIAELHEWLDDFDDFKESERAFHDMEK